MAKRKRHSMDHCEIPIPYKAPGLRLFIAPIGLEIVTPFVSHLNSLALSCLQPAMTPILKTNVLVAL
jgi:hypothetical protein